jgi:hypothetical protein
MAKADWFRTCHLYLTETTSEIISKYHLVTSKHWPGSIVFRQIDQQGVIRNDKIMLYDDLAGHRSKNPLIHIAELNPSLRMNNFSLCQCFFGEHLLNV